MTTIKLEDLHGRVMDVLGYEMLPHPHFAKVFGEPGRQYLEAYKEQFGGMWKAVVEADPPEIKEITLETVWTKKGKSAPSAHDLSRRPAVLDAMGIRRQLITPALILTALPASTGRTNMTPPPPSENVAVAISLLDAYNEWAVELTRKYSDRFRLPGVVPATALSVDELVKRTERLIASGIKLVAIPSRMPPAGLSPGDPALDPFYAALAKANVPLILRGGSFAQGYRLSEVWGKVPPSIFGKEFPYLARDITMINSVHQAEETFLTAMVLGGVFERHPALRFGLLKVGAGWLGPLAERLDRGLLPFFKATHLPMKPSEYLNRNVRVTPWADGGDGRVPESAEGGDGDDYEPVDVYFERYPSIQNCYCYASDYPLDEGGKWSLRKFYQRIAPLGDEIVEKYFCKNAELLMP